MAGRAAHAPRCDAARPGDVVVGIRLSSPLLLAPIGAASLVAANSDVIIARGAASAGTAYVISSQGCNPMEDTAAAMGSTPFWYQLYWSTDEGLVDSMIGRAGAVAHELWS